ncbi:MAG: methionine synthase [candidate division Zixibacteria bacterium]|nr:methionine synthase [candidate division Zixibacteria bacterium]
MLLTTTVGSFPKPDYLVKARNLFGQKKISREELKELERKATQEVIKLQEEIGLDILVHGEMERGDMVTFFAERLQGFTMSGLVRSYGNRYYRKPIIKGKIKRVGSIALEMFQYAQSLTGKPVKGMLTGPYTMCDWSFDEYFRTRRDSVLNLAEVVHEEALDLDEAGAEYIQIDEPAISTRPEEIDLAIEAMRVVTSGLKAKTISHICYGDFSAIYPKILDLAVDQLDLEFANNDFANLQIFKNPPFTKEIAVGVIDVHSYKIEKKEKVKENIKKALEVFPLEKVYIDPDCGLKTRTPQEAEAKLKVMVSAVKEIKKEMGL